MNELSEIKKLLEISIQQKSASDSDIKEQIVKFREHLSEQDRALERVDKKVDLTIVQTTKTNGSVKDLQLKDARNEGYIKGFGISVICIIALVGLIYASIMADEQKTQNLIEQHINSTQG